MLIASQHRWAMVTEHKQNAEEPTLDQLISKLDQSGLDIILVEGFKSEQFTKIEVYRSALNQAPLFENDPDIIAIASDIPLILNESVSQLDINNIQLISDFILQHFELLQ